MGIRPPPLPEGHVRRDEASLALERVTANKVTVVSGLPGSGKTALLVDWYANLGERKSWLSIAGASPNSEEFVAALIDAMSIGLEDTGRADGLSASPEQAWTALIHHVGRLPNEVISVIDGYQSVNSHEIHRLMRSLFNRMPPNWHVVIGSRALPPIGLARLRVEGSLLEVGNESLRFDRHETLAYLQNRLGHGVPVSSANALNQSTRGWITGIRLAAEAAKQASSSGKVLRSYSGTEHGVVSYVNEEILAGMDAAERDLVLITGFLGRLNHSLCEAVTEDPTAWPKLRTLADATGVMDAPIYDASWLAHPVMLAEAYGEILRRTDPGRAKKLGSRAHEWHKGHGTVCDVISIRSRSDDDALRKAVSEALTNADHVTDHMPDGPWISFIRSARNGIGELPLELELMETQRSVDLGTVEASEVLPRLRSHISLLADPDRADELAIAVDWVELRSLLDEGETAAAVEQAARLDSWLRSSPPANNGPWRGLGRIAATVARAHWLGDRVDEATQVLARFLGSEAAEGARSEGFGLWAVIQRVQGARDLPRQIARIPSSERDPEGGEQPLLESPYAVLAKIWGEDRGFQKPVERPPMPPDYEFSSDLDLVKMMIEATVAIRAGDQDKSERILQIARVKSADLGSLQLRRLVDVVTASALKTSGRGLGALSLRELDVLELLSGPLSRNQIASRLFISENTVKTHIRNIYDKLGVNSRQEAVRVGVELGLLDGW